MAKPDLRDHRKFLKLKRLLPEPVPHLIGYLECLWLRGYQTGSDLVGDADDVEAAAEYPGERGRLAAALIASGFVDQDSSGVIRIHDLAEHAPRYARERIRRKGEKAKRKAPLPVVPESEVAKAVAVPFESNRPARAEATFADFWARYPRKESKQLAQRAWRSLSLVSGLDDDLLRRILSAVDAWLPEWTRRETRFVPLAHNWIEGRKWEDELPKPKGEAKGQTLEERLKNLGGGGS